MHKWCKSPGCSRRSANRYGAYCSKHSATKRRHGHPDQKGVTKAGLLPYLQMVQERRAKHPDKKAWETMEAKWMGLVEAMKPLAENRGPTNKYGRIASREIVKLGIYVEAKKVV